MFHPSPLECCFHTLNVHNDNIVRGEISLNPQKRSPQENCFSQALPGRYPPYWWIFPPKLGQDQHQGETPRMKSATYERFLPLKCCVNLGGWDCSKKPRMVVGARHNNFQNSAFLRWKLFIEKFSPHWQIFAAQTVKVVGAIFGFFKFAERNYAVLSKMVTTSSTLWFIQVRGGVDVTYFGAWKVFTLDV